MNKEFLIKAIGNGLNTLSLIAPKLSIKKALDVFAKPRKGKILSNQKAFLETALQTTLDFNNQSIQTYFWQGSNNKTVLLAHGWESNSFRWKDLAEALLSKDYNVLALDAPAHGASSGKYFTAVDYAAFMNEVCKTYSPNHIIGHSVGGMASIFYLHDYGNPNIEKLVTLGAPSEFKDIFKNYTNMMGYNNTISEGLDEYIYERYGKYPYEFSSAKFASEIEAKGLIIHDIKDRIIPFSDAKLIKSYYKNAILHQTKGLGHGLKDQSINDTIINFLNE